MGACYLRIELLSTKLSTKDRHPQPLVCADAKVDPDVKSLALIQLSLAFHASYDPTYSLKAQSQCDFWETQCLFDPDSRSPGLEVAITPSD